MTAALPLEEEQIERILGIIRDRTGLDFSRYRQSTVRRRLQGRMATTGVDSIRRYLELLSGSEEEAGRLVERLTVKVSRFYRNAGAFDRVRGEVMPRLVSRSRGPLRFWSAGCAGGEEAYTLALLLDERGAPGSVLATDIDRAALDRARSALFPPASLVELPQALRDAGLVPSTVQPGSWRVHGRIVWRTRLQVHDLAGAEDPEGGPFDFIACRNVLIYMQRDARERVGRMLLENLAQEGYLLLGEAEAVPAPLEPHVEAVSRAHRLYRRLDGTS